MLKLTVDHFYENENENENGINKKNKSETRKKNKNKQQHTYTHNNKVQETFIISSGIILDSFQMLLYVINIISQK